MHPPAARSSCCCAGSSAPPSAPLSRAASANGHEEIVLTVRRRTQEPAASQDPPVVDDAILEASVLDTLTGTALTCRPLLLRSWAARLAVLVRTCCMACQGPCSLSCSSVKQQAVTSSGMQACTWCSLDIAILPSSCHATLPVVDRNNSGREGHVCRRPVQPRFCCRT